MLIDHQLGPLPSSNFMSGRSGHSMEFGSAQDPSYVVIHTMVGTVASANSIFHVDGHQTSAHYGVSATELVQWVSEDDTAYHSGSWDMNLNSIGIEHEDGGDYNGVRPDALYVRSGALVNWICTRYGIPITRQYIIRHNEVPGSSTGCPDALDIDRIVAEAQTGDDLFMALSTDQEAQLVDMLSKFPNLYRTIGDLFWALQITGADPDVTKAHSVVLDKLAAGGVNLAPVLSAIADLKAHPAAADPEVKALLLKIEKAFQAA